MKLRNKKTGEIIELPDGFFCGDNLKKICDKWEDVPEEPFSKDFYTIFDGEVKHCICYRERVAACPDDAHAYLGEYGREQIDNLKSVGLYFETKEEAELAVRKLKAWKRLKDKGFKFNNFVRDVICYEISVEEIKKDDVRKDLNLLFGGKE